MTAILRELQGLALLLLELVGAEDLEALLHLVGGGCTSLKQLPPRVCYPAACKQQRQV